MLCLQSAVLLEPGHAPSFAREGHGGVQSSFGTFGVGITPAPALAATTRLGDTGELGVTDPPTISVSPAWELCF